MKLGVVASILIRFVQCELGKLRIFAFWALLSVLSCRLIMTYFVETGESMVFSGVHETIFPRSELDAGGLSAWFTFLTILSIKQKSRSEKQLVMDISILLQLMVAATTALKIYFLFVSTSALFPVVLSPGCRTISTLSYSSALQNSVASRRRLANILCYS